MRAPWQAAGAHKLIPSDGWAEELGVRMRLVDTRTETTKLASTIFGSTYDELRPPKGHTGVHLVAYGDFERWGANRNGDSFPTAASRRYHDTFTKYARVYRNHANKDPRKAIGDVLRSAHNPGSHRVELFVAMHNDKAGAELQRLATDGELPWSMGCKVPGDRCSVCQRFRKNASDPRQCADVRDHLGDVLADGQIVAVHNDNPIFYDISPVPRGADRTAFSMKVAGTWGAARGAAAASGPDEQFLRHFTDDSERELRRFDIAGKLAAAQSRMRAPWLYSGGQAYFDQLVMKAARTPFAGEHVEIMRKAPPGDLWRKLAAAGVVLPADAFFACAFHGDEDFQACKEAALAIVRSGTFAALLGRPEEKVARTNAYFDLDAPQFTGYQWSAGSNAVAGLVDKLAANAFAQGAARLSGDGAASGTLVPGTANAEWDEQALEAVGAYAAYKLSAVQAIESIHPTVDHALLLDLAAAQDLVN